MWKIHLSQCMVKCVENISRMIWEWRNTSTNSHNFCWSPLQDIKISDIFYKIKNLNLKLVYPVLPLLPRILKALSPCNLLLTLPMGWSLKAQKSIDNFFHIANFLKLLLVIPTEFPHTNNFEGNEIYARLDTLSQPIYSRKKRVIIRTGGARIFELPEIWTISG